MGMIKPINSLSQLWTYGQTLEREFTHTNHQPYLEAYKLLTKDLAGFSKLNEQIVNLNTFRDLDHFYSFQVPLERHLSKDLKDSDFIILSKDQDKGLKPLPLVFILHNIRSSYNVGSFFRLADCLNIEKIYLTGYTCGPENTKVQKSSLNAHENVEWEKINQLSEVIAKLQGHKIYALETTSNATNLYSKEFDGPTTFLFGNEQFGLTNLDIDYASETLAIPTRGHKNSLNVVMAASLVSYEYLRQFSLR